VERGRLAAPRSPQMRRGKKRKKKERKDPPGWTWYGRSDNFLLPVICRTVLVLAGLHEARGGRKGKRKKREAALTLHPCRSQP